MALHRPLTPREAAVLALALTGQPPRVIAVRLKVKVSTVETHLKAIDRKIPGHRPRMQRFALWAAGCPLAYLSLPGNS